MQRKEKNSRHGQSMNTNSNRQSVLLVVVVYLVCFVTLVEPHPQRLSLFKYMDARS